MNPEIENQIRSNVTWNKLPSNLKQVIFYSNRLFLIDFLNQII